VFSSFGDGVHLMAPGGSGLGGPAEDVLSTYPRDRYASIAGTSQAAPHVTGIAALLVSLGVRGEAAAQRIVSTSSDAGAPGTDEQYGAGIANARAAVAGLGAPPPVDPGKPGEPPPAAIGSYTAPRTVKLRTARKRGITVVCKAVRPGTCRVKAYRDGRKIARGHTDVPAGSPTAVTAVLNARGRKRLARVKHRMRVKLAITLPGEPARTRKVWIQR
jgi:Subtilase family